jgi:hypothetical protein
VRAKSHDVARIPNKIIGAVFIMDAFEGLAQ